MDMTHCRRVLQQLTVIWMTSEVPTTSRLAGKNMGWRRNVSKSWLVTMQRARRNTYRPLPLCFGCTQSPTRRYGSQMTRQADCSTRSTVLGRSTTAGTTDTFCHEHSCHHDGDTRRHPRQLLQIYKPRTKCLSYSQSYTT